jgi:hypothetical protein
MSSQGQGRSRHRRLVTWSPKHTEPGPPTVGTGLRHATAEPAAGVVTGLTQQP